MYSSPEDGDVAYGCVALLQDSLPLGDDGHGSDVAGTIPLVGEPLLNLLLGDVSVGGEAGDGVGARVGVLDVAAVPGLHQVGGLPGERRAGADDSGLL